MKISWVIPTYNNFDVLIKTIKNIIKQTRKPDIIFVVDNASSDNTSNVVKEFPEIKYIKLNINAGSAGGYSEGMKAASEVSDLIFLSDDDMLFDKNAIKYLEESLLLFPENERIGVVRCAWDGFKGDKAVEVESSICSGVLIKSSAIKKTGLPLLELFTYADDVEYFYRMRKKGLLLYLVPKAKYLSKSLEHRSETKFFGFRVAVYKTDFRLYYAFRNEIYINRLHGKSTIKVLLYFLKVMFFLKFSGLIAAIDGIKNGFMGNLGKSKKYIAIRGKEELNA